MNRLKILRESKALTQKTLCETMGINQGNYSRYEKGSLLPTTETLILLSKYYNVSIDYMLGLDKSKDDIKMQLELIRDYIENMKENI